MWLLQTVILSGTAWLLCLRVMDTFLRGAHPADSLMCMLRCRPEAPWFVEGLLPLDLAGMNIALAHWPPVEDVDKGPLIPGA